MTTGSLSAITFPHPLAEQMRQLKSQLISDGLANWLAPGMSRTNWHLALYQFATEKPHRYLHTKTVEETLDILRSNGSEVFCALQDHEADITRAVFSLLRPGSSWRKDAAEITSIDTPQDIEDFDAVWHPEYVRYCEQIYNHLMKVPLHVLGKRKGKNYTGPALPVRVQLLADSGLLSLIRGYDSVVRNAISHGRIAYGVSDIQYIDVKTHTSLFAWDFITLFDSLVETCNSLLVAILLFLIEQQIFVEKQGIDKLPLGLKFLFVDGFASHVGSSLVSFSENLIKGGKQQLNIALRISSVSRAAHRFEAMFATWVACHFGGSKYDRFLVSIDCGMPGQPLVALNGQALREAIANGKTPFEVAATILESSLLWYDTSSARAKLFLLQNSLKVNWHIHKRKFDLSRHQAGVFVPSLHYEVVSMRNTSPKAFRRVEAHVVLKLTGKISEKTLLQIVGSALSRVRRVWLRRKDLYGERGLPGPPQSVTVRIYSGHAHLRRLASFSWQDEELAAIVEWSKDWRKAPPFYTRQADRVINGFRVKYNPKITTFV